MSQLPQSHAWVPIEKCGDLAPGMYVTGGYEATGAMLLEDGGAWLYFDECDGEWAEAGSAPSHILNPFMGPIPEVEE